ncbi:MAG: 6-phosphogluconate dehydrogenase (decarboxylating) [Actinobacteria bacterium]|nr:MAG: 6-phosphogluconate dehydrogenase (decarboxylating) [Actinomycetota bacterium]
MELGIYGLGRMGANMVRRLAESGDHRVIAGNRSPEPVGKAVEQGAEGAYSMEEFVEKMEERPRVLWTMLPAGDVTGKALRRLAALADEGDIIVDGANSYFRDSVRRAEEMGEGSLRWLDAGVSGGVWGYEVGYNMMVGGDASAFEHVEPALKTLAPPNGYAYLGEAGAGHFTKMVHNGVEYGMMQAYAEGFEILEKSQYDFDLHAISSLWNQGSVVRSWLLELAENAFEQDGHLDSVRGYAEDSGEGRWTILEAINEDVPAHVISASLFARFASRQDDSFAMKVVAALRGQFGGHAIQEASTRYPEG